MSRPRSTLLVLATLCAACATAASRLPTAAPLPPNTTARDAVLQDFGERAFAALVHGAPAELLFDDEALRALLLPASAARAASLRNNVASSFGAGLEGGGLFRGARYLGLCIQGARLESAGGAVALRDPAWVFDRVLVVAEEPGGGKVGAWAEGLFVNTDQGVAAVDLSRVEPPRRDHADLEIAACDLTAGTWRPQPVVGDPLLDH